MTYRPQFCYPPAPVGFEDDQFHYSFDGTNTPLLSSSNPIAAGGFANDIILPMQADAPFLCRAIKFALGVAASQLYVQLRTPHGDYIERPYVPLSLWASPGSGIQPAGFLFIPLPDQVESPKGSNWTLFLYNPTGGGVNPPAVTLYGVKRWPCDARRRRAS